MTYDLAIVGGGSAAFSAAIHARRKHLAVVMVESGHIGGTCVNVGCIPSKALLAAAEVRHAAAENRFPGITTSADRVDMAALVAGKDHVVRDLRQDKYVDLAREYDWKILRGRASFTAGPALEVEGHRVEAKHYLIATGSQPWTPPIEGLGCAPFLTSTTAMELDSLPESILVVGGNYIGLELGQLFSRLGAQVTIIEALERLAPREEPEISALIERVFRDEHIGVHTRATVMEVRSDSGSVRAQVDLGGRRVQLSAAALLMATGRRANTEGMNLQAVGVDTGAHGEVLADDHLRTTNPRIWAAGDVTGHPQFVYVAGAHGVVAVENAFEHAGRTVDYRTLPRVTFTSPNIAAVGLTEAEAEEQGLDCECRTISLDVVPRALVNRDTRGLVKIVAERKTGTIRGVHILAQDAGDCVLAGVYAIDRGMTVQEVANIWCPYLTMSEGIKLAAQAFFVDVAKLSCCGA